MGHAARRFAGPYVDPLEEPELALDERIANWRSVKRHGPPMGRDWVEHLLIKHCGRGWDSVGGDEGRDDDRRPRSSRSSRAVRKSRSTRSLGAPARGSVDNAQDGGGDALVAEIRSIVRMAPVCGESLSKRRKER